MVLTIASNSSDLPYLSSKLFQVTCAKVSLCWFFACGRDILLPSNRDNLSKWYGCACAFWAHFFVDFLVSTSCCCLNRPGTLIPSHAPLAQGVSHFQISLVGPPVPWVLILFSYPGGAGSCPLYAPSGFYINSSCSRVVERNINCLKSRGIHGVDILGIFYPGFLLLGLFKEE